jgi:hypothetical protein
MMSNIPLSARIDAIAASLLRAHGLVTDERLALTPEAIRPTTVSRDDSGSCPDAVRSRRSGAGSGAIARPKPQLELVACRNLWREAGRCAGCWLRWIRTDARLRLAAQSLTLARTRGAPPRQRPTKPPRPRRKHANSRTARWTRGWQGLATKALCHAGCWWQNRCQSASCVASHGEANQHGPARVDNLGFRGAGRSSGARVCSLRRLRRRHRRRIGWRERRGRHEVGWGESIGRRNAFG